MLLIEAYLNGRWHACATLKPQGTGSGRRMNVRVAYEAAYAQDHLGAADLRAISCRHPVNLGPINSAVWPAFLIDLLPQGAAKRRLLQLAGVDDLPEWELLRTGAWNPVGNLRVRREDPPVADNHPGFELAEVMSRGEAFIDHAHSVGAAVAGATDTQGEMPKFWLVEDRLGRMHADAGHVDAMARGFYLVKFPSKDAGEHRQAMLRNEASYQRVAQVFGLRVTPRLPEVIDGGLLIPRFDRALGNGVVQRLGVESVYSLTGTIESGAQLRHDQVLLALHKYGTDFEADLLEYLGRDVLNLAMGNRDNHGRNTAVLKELDGTVRLSPLFDFGPSFLDERGLPRATNWPQQRGHRVDWNAAILDLGDRFADEGVDLAPHITPIMQRLRGLGGQIERLPDTMRTCGVDDFIIERRVREITEIAADLQALGDVPTMSIRKRRP